MTTPDVSLIIGAYNAMPYLTTCLQSAVDQSIGHDRMEIIIVNDGSTDATLQEMERFVAAYPNLFTLIDQPNSGGPSGPRNTGLDAATGKYVFFLDADDYLGVEALERLVAMAETQNSDVVLGKIVGVNRGAPASMFKENQPQANLYTSRVWWTLSAYKLFRRANIERKHLRFPTHYRIGEDQLFVSQLFLEATTISVVADYDCYYLVKRDDGKNITATDVDMTSRLAFLHELCDFIAAQVPAGKQRNHLFARQFGYDLESFTGNRTLKKPATERHALLDQAKDIITEWGNEELMLGLPLLVRLRFELIRRGEYDAAMEMLKLKTANKPLPERLHNGAVYLDTQFQNKALGIPDKYFQTAANVHVTAHLINVDFTSDHVRITGEIHYERLLRNTFHLQIHLRGRLTGQNLPLTTAVSPTGGKTVLFSAQVALNTLQPQITETWDFYLTVQGAGTPLEYRLGYQQESSIFPALEIAV